MNTIKFGIPKGSLEEATLKTLRLAGFDIEIPKRSYNVKIDDPEIECFLLRSQEIPKYVENGLLDLGICGDDWIAETNAKVVEVCDLRYAKHEIKKVRWVLAVPENSKIKSVKDLAGKTISTEAVNLVKNYLKKNRVKAKIDFSWGATEVKPPMFTDAIVDITETGASIKAHNLKILDTVFTSSTKLVANKKAWQDKWKKEKIRNLAILLEGAVASKELVGLVIHVPKDKLKKILQILPALKKPTVTKIAGEKDWYDVLTDVPGKQVRELVPQLKKMGCQGIVEFPLNTVVL